MRSINRSYVGLGIALGVVFGAALGRIGLGIALGVVFGVALSAASARKNRLNSN
jgi:hypothetical protein